VLVVEELQRKELLLDFLQTRERLKKGSKG
jgi:hypothetical protein